MKLLKTIIGLLMFAVLSNCSGPDSTSAPPADTPCIIYNVPTGVSDYRFIFNSPTIYNSKLYFEGSTGVENKIYEFDGTSIKNVSPGSSGYTNIFYEPFIYDSKLFFAGSGNKIYMLK